MFLKRIRKQLSKIVSRQSSAKPSITKDAQNTPLTAINNNQSTPQQGESTQKSFPENYFDADSLFK